MAGAKKQSNKGSGIDSDIFSRVFCIRCGSRRGTGFSVDVDDRQYLITATHLLQERQDGKVLELFHGGKWKPLETTLIGSGPPQIDVTILALQFRITLPEILLPPLGTSLQHGQEVLCLGFPLGEWKRVEGATPSFPTPFLKRGVVAYVSDPSSAVKCVFVDCLPNPGFSGGPVLFREKKEVGWRVGAIVSGFEYDHHPIHFGDDQVQLSADPNSRDLMVAYDMNQAINLINLNPSGFSLKQSE